MRVIPTGVCWCGCGAEVRIGSFFCPGHDKLAEARVIREVFGDVATFLAAFGYAPADARRADDAHTKRALLAVLGALDGKFQEIHEAVTRIARSQG